MKSVSQKIRSGDWRFSFIPQIFGTLYLWIYIFRISFSIGTLFLLFLSFITSVGFASLGYFINEYFDRKDDFLAGKENQLRTLGWKQLLLLLSAILCVTLAPWIWLPSDSLTVFLVGIQISLFILYAVPPFRLKNNFVAAPVIDTLYAYVLPLLLSCHTFFLFSAQRDQLSFFILLTALLFFIAGYRNIIIHYLKDLKTDQRLTKKTLPKLIGVRRSLTLVITLVYTEYTLIVFLLLNSIRSSSNSALFAAIILPVVVLHFLANRYRKKKSALIFIKSPNTLYQFFFPLIFLINLIVTDFHWAIWIPAHLILLIPAFRYKPVTSWWQRINFQKMFIAIKQLLSWIVNYGIFFLFLIVGVNLRKKHTSARAYLQTRFTRLFNKTN